MKIIYCPPGEDPQELARKALKRRVSGGGGFLQENWWLILGIVAFAVIGVTVGPFKGLFTKEQQTPTPLVQDVSAAPEATAAIPAPPIFCQNPGGGLIADGDTAWVDHSIEIAQYRCEGGNLVKLQAITQTLQIAP